MRRRYFFVLPFVVFLLIFFFLPVAGGVLLPFFSDEAGSVSNFGNFDFSPGNFRTAFSAVWGESLFDAVRNTVLYTVCVSAGSILLGLSGALLVTQKFPTAGIVRILLTLSWVVPTYIVGLLWGFMWQQDEGIVNIVLFDFLHWDKISGFFGAVWKYSADGVLVKPSWLTGQNAFWAIVVPTVWRNWPFCMMMFLSGLAAIPRNIYEATELDGIPPRERFFHITLPVLRPVFAVVILETLVVNVYSFNLIAMMFGNGSGFPGKFGDLMMTFVYRTSFQSWNFGAGAALGTLMMFVMLIGVSVWYKAFAKDLLDA